jgi:hypothetical protein
MSDIQVDSELLLERAAFLADLRASQQEVEQFVNACNAMKIEIPVRMRDELTTAVQRLVADINASGLQINIPVVMGGVGGAGGGGGITDSFNTAIQQNNMMLQQLQMLQQTQNNINNTMSSVVNNIVNNSGGGGGGGGRANIGGLPIGRGISAMMLLHQAVEFYHAEEKSRQQMLNTGGDEYKIMEATIEHRKAHDSMFFGIGEMGRNIGEGLINGPMGWDTVESEEEALRHEKAADKNIEQSLKQRDYSRSVDRRYNEQTADGSRGRAEIAMKGRHDEAADKLKEGRLKENKEVEDRRRERDIETDDKFGMSYNPLWGEGNFLNIEGPSEKFTQGKNASAQARDREMKALRIARAKEDAQTKADNDAEEERLKAENDMADKQAGYGAAASELRSRGDFAGAARLERKAKHEEGQLRANNESPAAGAAYAREAAADDIVSESEESFRRGSADFSSGQRITNTRAGAFEANLRMSGKTRQAGDEAFSRQLQEEIDAKDRAARDPNKEVAALAAAEAQALRDAMPSKIAEHNQDEDRRQQYDKARTQDRIEDMGVNVRAANLKAGGFNVEAGNIEYENSLKDKVKALRESADAEKDGVKKSLMLSEAEAEEAANTKLVSARKAEQARMIDLEVKAQEDAAKSGNLRGEGRFYEAGLNDRKSAYDRQAEADSKIADPVERAKKLQADKDAYDSKEKEAKFNHDNEVGQLNDEARAKHYANAGDNYNAGLSRINSKYDRDEKNAAGDTTKIAALQLNRLEDIHAFMIATWGKGANAMDRAHDLQQRILDGADFKPPPNAANRPPAKAPGGPHPPNWIPPTRRGNNVDPDAIDGGTGSGFNGPSHLHSGNSEYDPSKDEWYQDSKSNSWHHNLRGGGSPDNSADREAPGYMDKLQNMRRSAGLDTLSMTNTGAAGLQSAMQQKKDSAVDKFSDSANKWSDIADKISNAPTLIVGDLA